jgi:hypothetical protein
MQIYYILSHIWGCVTIDRVWSWVLDIFTPLVHTTREIYIIITLLLISTLHKSPGHAKSSQSSLVISWQRIYDFLTVTTERIKSSLRSRTSKLTTANHKFITLILQSSVNCQLQDSPSNSLLLLPTTSLPFLLSYLRLPILNWLSVVIHSVGLGSSLHSFGADPT